MSIPKLSGEALRWIAAAAVGIILFAVSKTWAFSELRRDVEKTVDAVAGKVETIAAKVDSNQRESAAIAAGILKELDAREAKRDLELKTLDRRLAELGTMAQTNQALLVSVEGLKTEIRYLTAGVAEIKADLKEKKREGP
jgi:flagellar motility protein MotE (MotC chaperone)